MDSCWTHVMKLFIRKLPNVFQWKNRTECRLLCVNVPIEWSKWTSKGCTTMTILDVQGNKKTRNTNEVQKPNPRRENNTSFSKWSSPVPCALSIINSSSTIRCLNVKNNYPWNHYQILVIWELISKVYLNPWNHLYSYQWIFTCTNMITNNPASSIIIRVTTKA